MATEIREINFNENLEDAVPDSFDEDRHADDYNDYAVYYAEDHYSEEYDYLRSIGLSDHQARRVIRETCKIA